MDKSLTGTSIFDPVLCEILIKWFCVPNGKIIDPFAGGSVRGLVSAILGNEYAAIVVGDVRDKNGHYYNFVGDTVEICKRAGLHYYNECILLNQIATGALRARRQFEGGRKVIKTHQNVLVFLKGDHKKLYLPKIDIANIEELENGA